MKKTKGWWLRVIVRSFGGLLLFLLLVPLLPLEIGFKFAYLLLLGWIHYLSAVLPRVRFSAQVALEAGIALGLATYGLHRILGWWSRRVEGGTGQWRFSWTLKITTMGLLLFATAIAATGFIHQVGWLFKVEKWFENRSMGRLTRELSNLKQVGLGIKLFANDHEGKFPNSLLELVPDYLPESRLLFSTLDDTEPPEMFTYLAGYSESDLEEQIILASPRPSKSAKRGIIQTDIAGMLINESEFQERLQKQLRMTHETHERDRAPAL